MKSIINKKGLELNIGDMKVTVGGIAHGGEVYDFSPHFHSEYEFHFVTSGKAEVKSRFVTTPISEGEHLIVAPDVSHWTSFDTGFDRFTFIFSMSRTTSKKDGFSEYDYYKEVFSSVESVFSDKCDEIHKAINSIIDLLDYKSDLSFHKLKNYFATVFIRLGEEIDSNFRSVKSDKNISGDTSLKKSALRIEIGEYIVGNFASSNILKDLSAQLHMSTRNTTRIVKELFGVPLSKLVLNQRMNYAGSCIEETELPLNLIAQQAGYCDYSTFYRAFKNFYGKSPEELKFITADIANEDTK